ncbi:MAG: hypothetical protein Kow0068_08000 [Marinilabiliales bacterium]
MKSAIKYFILIGALAILFSGCKKDEDLLSSPSNNIGTKKVLETLSGIVVDEFGAPLADVTVMAHGQTYITKADGFYIFSNLLISNNRYVVSFSHNDYFSVVRSDAYEAGKPGRIDVQLIPLTPSATNDSTSFMANTGGTLNVGTLITLDFPPDVFMYESGLPYNGRVHVAAAYSDPTTNNYNRTTYGGDQRGVDPSTNMETVLQAFVGTSIELRDDAGNKLQLNPNMQQQVSFTLEIPAPLANAAPSKIDIFTYDNTGGLKMANYSGSNINQATKTGGKYQGALGHFSFISCELAYTMTANVRGTVTDINGNPVPGVLVQVGQSYAITDANGYYNREVPAGVQMQVGIPDYFGAPYGLQNITPYNITVHNITGLPVTQTVTGKLVDCDGNPIAGHINIDILGYIISTYTQTGTFAINTPAGSFDFYAYGNNSHYDQQFVVNPNLGNITLCPQYTLGQSYVVLTGGPMMFSGYVHPFDQGTFQGYVYYTSNPLTSILAGDTGNMDYLSVSVDGDATGTYTIGFNAQVDIELRGDLITLETGTVQISRFDPVGGLIEGTFSGTASDGTQATGAFSVYRIQ